MEANGYKHLAATVTRAEKDTSDGTDADLERRRILLGDIEAETGIEAVTSTEKGDGINTEAEVATANEDLGVRQKKRTVGVHDTIALATTTPSATAAH